MPAKLVFMIVSVEDKTTSTKFMIYPDEETPIIVPGPDSMQFPQAAIVVANVGDAPASHAFMKVRTLDGTELYREEYKDVPIGGLKYSSPFNLPMPDNPLILVFETGLVTDSQETVTHSIESNFVNGRVLYLSVNDPDLGTTDPSPGTYLVAKDTVMTIQAIPNENAKFEYWLIDNTIVSRNPIQISMSENYEVTAVFSAIETRRLTISVNDPTLGTTDPPPGEYDYAKGSEVTVQAIPSENAKFSYWVLDGEQKLDNPITIIMDRDYTLTAVFEPLQQYNLVIDVFPSEGGTTNDNYPPGTYTLNEGTTVTVEAIPNPGYRFSHWIIDNEQVTDNPITITMDDDYHLTAIFEEAPKHRLTISVNDPTMGTTDPPPGEYTYPEGETVTVEAIPNPGYQFDYWVLDESTVTDNPITITMDDDHHLTAIFKEAPPPTRYTLTIKIVPEDGSLGTTDPPPGDHPYDEGTQVTVTAIPTEKGRFSHWTLDGETRTENPITITMDSNYTLTAYFEEKPAITASLTGKVKTFLDLPVIGATVTLLGPVSATTKTDFSGTYRFDNLPSGAYTIKVEHPLFQSSVEPLDITESKEYVVNFTLSLNPNVTAATATSIAGIIIGAILWTRRPAPPPKKKKEETK